MGQTTFDILWYWKMNPNSLLTSYNDMETAQRPSLTRDSHSALKSAAKPPLKFTRTSVASLW